MKNTIRIRNTMISLLVAFPTLVMCQEVQVNNAFEKGVMKDGIRSGIWKYFDEDSVLGLSINYDKGTLVYLRPDSTSYLILHESQWMWVPLQHYPRYLGSWRHFYGILADRILYPRIAREQSIERRVFLQFTIGTAGQVTELKVINDQENIFRPSLQQAFEGIPNLWLTAHYKGRNVPTKFVLPVTFRIGQDSRYGKYDPNKEEWPEGKRLQEIIVTAMGI